MIISVTQRSFTVNPLWRECEIRSELQNSEKQKWKDNTEKKERLKVRDHFKLKPNGEKTQYSVAVSSQQQHFVTAAVPQQKTSSVSIQTTEWTDTSESRQRKQ